MPRRRRERLNSDNYIPVNGRLYIEYWIDGIEDIREDPIHVERLNIQYHPPLTRQEAIEYVNSVYNAEVRQRLPYRHVIDYTVDFSADSQDVLFDPSGHNEENSEYIAQIVVVIHPSNPDQLITLLEQNQQNLNNQIQQQINNQNEVIPADNNAPTATPPNSPRSVGSLASIGSTKTTNNSGFNGGKRRHTKRRNMKRKGSRRRRT